MKTPKGYLRPLVTTLNLCAISTALAWGLASTAGADPTTANCVANVMKDPEELSKAIADLNSFSAGVSFDQAALEYRKVTQKIEDTRRSMGRSLTVDQEIKFRVVAALRSGLQLQTPDVAGTEVKAIVRAMLLQVYEVKKQEKLLAAILRIETAIGPAAASAPMPPVLRDALAQVYAQMFGGSADAARKLVQNTGGAKRAIYQIRGESRKIVDKALAYQAENIDYYGYVVHYLNQVARGQEDAFGNTTFANVRSGFGYGDGSIRATEVPGGSGGGSGGWGGNGGWGGSFDPNAPGGGGGTGGGFDPPFGSGGGGVPPRPVEPGGGEPGIFSLTGPEGGVPPVPPAPNGGVVPPVTPPKVVPPAPIAVSTGPVTTEELKAVVAKAGSTGDDAPTPMQVNAAKILLDLQPDELFAADKSVGVDRLAKQGMVVSDTDKRFLTPDLSLGDPFILADRYPQVKLLRKLAHQRFQRTEYWMGLLNKGLIISSIQKGVESLEDGLKLLQYKKVITKTAADGTKSIDELEVAPFKNLNFRNSFQFRAIMSDVYDRLLLRDWYHRVIEVEQFVQQLPKSKEWNEMNNEAKAIYRGQKTLERLLSIGGQRNREFLEVFARIPEYRGLFQEAKQAALAQSRNTDRREGGEAAVDLLNAVEKRALEIGSLETSQLARAKYSARANLVDLVAASVVAAGGTAYTFWHGSDPKGSGEPGAGGTDPSKSGKPADFPSSPEELEKMLYPYRKPIAPGTSGGGFGGGWGNTGGSGGSAWGNSGGTGTGTGNGGTGSNNPFDPYDSSGSGGGTGTGGSWFDTNSGTGTGPTQPGNIQPLDGGKLTPAEEKAVEDFSAAALDDLVRKAGPQPQPK